MKKTHLRRALAAVGTAIACLGIMANPAAATPHEADLTGGIITLTKTGVTETIDLTPGGTGSCGTGALDFDETGTAISVTSFTASSVRTFSTTGTFLAVIDQSTIGNSPGTLNSTTNPHTITGLRVGVRVNIYQTTGCSTTGLTPICQLGIVLNLSGTSNSMSASNTFSLTGASVGTMAAFPTCTTGPSYLVGTTATVTTPITGHIAT